MKRILFVMLIAGLAFGGCKTAPKDVSVNPAECTRYACPMHPDKTSATPANCPVCGMPMDSVKLEPKSDSVNLEKDKKE